MNSLVYELNKSIATNLCLDRYIRKVDSILQQGERKS